MYSFSYPGGKRLLSLRTSSSKSRMRRSASRFVASAWNFNVAIYHGEKFPVVALFGWHIQEAQTPGPSIAPSVFYSVANERAPNEGEKERHSIDNNPVRRRPSAFFVPRIAKAKEETGNSKANGRTTKDEQLGSHVERHYQTDSGGPRTESSTTF
ncbi:hypothetical protein BC832DRAFT_541523 [Gaertneriomyces semiglobifer]|nr:hypothetical protein BC832DRAFT_541523 [Gaertneriomyces semiglobifer]